MGISTNFCKANRDDINQIVTIEDEFFGDYEKKFDFEFLSKWYSYNPDMFYVVKNESNEVLAFTILVPIKETLHNKLLNGEISEFFDFSEEEVCEGFASQYVYLADICVRNSKTSLRTTLKLISGTIKLIYGNVKYITTTPVTNEGLKISKHMGFQKISEQKCGDTVYDIYGLDLENQKEVENIYNSVMNRERKNR